MAQDDLTPGEARTPQAVSLRTIFNVVKAIEASSKTTEEAFLAMCDAADLRIVIQPDVINIVKRFLLENNVHRSSGLESLDAFTRDVIVSPGGRCP